MVKDDKNLLGVVVRTRKAPVPQWALGEWLWWLLSPLEMLVFGPEFSNFLDNWRVRCLSNFWIYQLQVVPQNLTLPGQVSSPLHQLLRSQAASTNDLTVIEGVTWVLPLTKIPVHEVVVALTPASFSFLSFPSTRDFWRIAKCQK